MKMMLTLTLALLSFGALATQELFHCEQSADETRSVIKFVVRHDTAGSNCMVDSIACLKSGGCSVGSSTFSKHNDSCYMNENDFQIYSRGGNSTNLYLGARRVEGNRFVGKNKLTCFKFIEE